MTDNTDIEHLVAAADALPAREATADDELQVRAVVYGMARRSLERDGATGDDIEGAPKQRRALAALAALNLTDPYQPIPDVPDAQDSTRRHPAGTTHGTRAAVGWHREQRVQMCGPCQRWADADDRIRARAPRTHPGEA